MDYLLLITRLSLIAAVAAISYYFIETIKEHHNTPVIPGDKSELLYLPAIIIGGTSLVILFGFAFYSIFEIIQMLLKI